MDLYELHLLKKSVATQQGCASACDWVSGRSLTGYSLLGERPWLRNLTCYLCGTSRRCGLVGGRVSLYRQALRAYAQAPPSMEESLPPGRLHPSGQNVELAPLIHYV